MTQNLLSFWAIFCLLTLLTTWKIKFWKNEKNAQRYYHFTFVYHKWRSCDIWFLIYGAQRTEFFVIWTILCPFTPPNTENQNFEKMKKLPEDIIILHMCTINEKSYDVSFLRYEHERKKHLEISSFWSWHAADVILLFHFGLLFTLLLPWKAQKNQNSKKKEKKRKKKRKKFLKYHFTHVYLKLWSDDAQFLRSGARQDRWADRQTDRQTDRKNDIQRWVPHLKICVRDITFLAAHLLFCLFPAFRLCWLYVEKKLLPENGGSAGKPHHKNIS